MYRIKSVSYKESRLEFFEKQLRGANRRLNWAVKRKMGDWELEVRGKEVSFYRDVVEMLKGEGE